MCIKRCLCWKIAVIGVKRKVRKISKLRKWLTIVNVDVTINFVVSVTMPIKLLMSD